MIRDVSDALRTTEKLCGREFPMAASCLLAGSVVRGEATATSDLDVVVLFDRVERARRRSLVFEGWPVEVFVHDIQTLRYFFELVDGPSGVPSLPNMVSEGLEVPQTTALGRQAKAMADRFLAAGPPAWGDRARADSRYAITDMVEDIRGARSADELRPVFAKLYGALADHYCRSHGFWSAKGKAIPKHLTALDPTLGQRFLGAFERAFVANNVEAIVVLAEEIIAPDGGDLFDGYVRDAPSDWRLDG